MRRRSEIRFLQSCGSSCDVRGDRRRLNTQGLQERSRRGLVHLRVRVARALRPSESSPLPGIITLGGQDSSLQHTAPAGRALRLRKGLSSGNGRAARSAPPARPPPRILAPDGDRLVVRALRHYPIALSRSVEAPPQLHCAQSHETIAGPSCFGRPLRRRTCSPIGTRSSPGRGNHTTSCPRSPSGHRRSCARRLLGPSRALHH